MTQPEPFRPLDQLGLPPAVLAPLRDIDFDDWPTPSQLDQLLEPAGLRAQIGPTPRSSRAYQQTIDEQCVLPVRPRDWHDLFNVLVWHRFPHTKLAVNRRLLECGYGPSGNGRTRIGDALTLIDECGVVIGCSDARLPDLNRARDWHTLFCDLRGAWQETALPVIFGHGLYEQLLGGHRRVVGRACWLTVEPDLTRQSPAVQGAVLDQALAEYVANIIEPANTQPLPVLGIPGWADAIQDEAFYADHSYFVPLRAR